MQTTNKFKAVFLLLIFICLACVVVFAQGPGFDDDVEDTPLDGGAAFVIVAVAGYAYKKIANKHDDNAK